MKRKYVVLSLVGMLFLGSLGVQAASHQSEVRRINRHFVASVGYFNVLEGMFIAFEQGVESAEASYNKSVEFSAGLAQIVAQAYADQPKDADKGAEIIKHELLLALHYLQASNETWRSALLQSALFVQREQITVARTLLSYALQQREGTWNLLQLYQNKKYFIEN